MKMAIKQIPIEDIVDNPFQPRKDFDRDALKSLADEMKAEGFWSGSLQGRRTKTGKIQLVFGHRRLRALKLLKTDTVPIEIVDLTDAQMALRSLEENLQREGLKDFEKADAVNKAIEIAEAERTKNGQPIRGALQEVADRLGLRHPWVSELRAVSVGIPTEDREQIQASELAAVTALAGKSWGGKTYVKTLVKQAKASKENPKLAKPTTKTVKAMKSIVQEAPEAIQGKLQAAIWTGEVTTPKEAEQKARRMSAERTKRNSTPPPPQDLETYLVGWDHRFDDWIERVKQLIPYLEYLDQVPASIRTPFDQACDRFLAIVETLETTRTQQTKATGPKMVGRGASGDHRKRIQA